MCEGVPSSEGCSHVHSSPRIPKLLLAFHRTKRLLQGWVGGDSGAERFTAEGEGYLLWKLHYKGEGGAAGFYNGGVVCHGVGNPAL